MSDSNSNHFVRESNTPVPVQTTLGVSATPNFDLSNPALLKLIEQGGTIASLILVCLFVWLLTKLIKVAKDD
jgi:hypothetical protein